VMSWSNDKHPLASSSSWFGRQGGRAEPGRRRVSPSPAPSAAAAASSRALEVAPRVDDRDRHRSEIRQNRILRARRRGRRRSRRGQRDRLLGWVVEVGTAEKRIAKMSNSSEKSPAAVVCVVEVKHTTSAPRSACPSFPSELVILECTAKNGNANGWCRWWWRGHRAVYLAGTFAFNVLLARSVTPACTHTTAHRLFLLFEKI